MRALVTSGYDDRLRDSGFTGAKMLPLTLGAFPEAGDAAAGSVREGGGLAALGTEFLP